MEPIETHDEASRLASFLRRMWPPGATARLLLTELPACGISLLSLETRNSREDWVRRVQMQIDHELVSPVADDLGIEMLIGDIRPEPSPNGVRSRVSPPN